MKKLLLAMCVLAFSGSAMASIVDVNNGVINGMLENYGVLVNSDVYTLSSPELGLTDVKSLAAYKLNLNEHGNTYVQINASKPGASCLVTVSEIYQYHDSPSDSPRTGYAVVTIKRWGNYSMQVCEIYNDGIIRAGVY